MSASVQCGNMVSTGSGPSGLASMPGQGEMVASSKRGEETLRVRSSQEEGVRLEADNC